MLKGYLLANMQDGQPRVEANKLWRERMRSLGDLQKDADSDFLKAWLRSQYALKIRERRKNALPEDWDRIGTEFHRWLRDSASRVGLEKQSDFHEFVKQDLDSYSRHYSTALMAGTWQNVPPGLEFVGYNSDRGFTLQYQLLLAPVRPDDSDVIVRTKMELVARYIDILLAWRIWNSRSIAYSTMSYAMFLTMRDIRGLGVVELADRLHGALSSELETFESNDYLRLHQQNRFQLHHLLARMTDYVAVQSGEVSRYREYTNGTGVRYEVEHIWADHAERHEEEFIHPNEFADHRNLIGDLLLLPKSFNASYNDAEYEVKLPHYFSQNILARSLNSQAYELNPGFRRFVKSSGLPFEAHETFGKKDVTERGELYRDLAKHVWNPTDILEAAGDAAHSKIV